MRKRYAALAAQPGALRFLALSLPMRMPIGTVGLGTLLHLRELTGSIAFAGSIVGAQLIAMAATAPFLGRLVDRRGPSGVLVACGVVCPIALAVMLAAGPLGLSRAAILAVALVAGASSPPLTVLVRTLWRMRLQDPALRQTAFAMDAVALEVAYTIGPALIAIAVAVGPPGAPLALALAFTAAAVPTMFASGGLDWWVASGPVERHLLGPLRDRRLLVLYATTFALAVSFGAIEVAYPAFGRAVGRDAWGPALLAICSIGSAIGGIAYGGLHLRAPLAHQVPIAMALIAAGLAAHVPVADPWLLALVAGLAGVLIAPAMTMVSLLVAEFAPSKYATEAFTWSATAIVTGLGAGMAVAGTLTERFGTGSTFAMSAAAAAIASALAIGLRRGR
jgi:predicted MFS family arabinose efflux permease